MRGRRGKARRPDSPNTALSKKLSWALRYGISELGLHMNPTGYVSIDQILNHPQFSKFSLQNIRNVVQHNSKKRFFLRQERGTLMIRTQGPSAPGPQQDPILSSLQDPFQFPSVYHSTYKQKLSEIEKRGLYRMTRNYIHLSVGLPEQHEQSSNRWTPSVFIIIDLPLAISDGIRFFLSDQMVVLTTGIHGFLSKKYFKKVIVDGMSVNFKRTPLDLDYILVLDFQANASNEGKLECQEIIEFPVQVLNTKNLEVEATFHYYVKPTVIPELTRFCIELTGIQQETVDSGILIQQALELFYSFLNQHGISDSRWIFLTCGDWDLKTCVPRELQYKRIQRPEYYAYWLNIKKLFPVEPKGLMECLEFLKIPHIGRHHSGIDDVANVINCVRGMIRAGVQFFQEDVCSMIKHPTVPPPFTNPKRIPEQKKEDPKSHITYQSLVLFTVQKILSDKEKLVAVAVHTNFFSLIKKTSISSQKKFIIPSEAVNFNIEEILMTTPELYRQRGVSVKECIEILVEMKDEKVLGQHALACISDQDVKALRNASDRQLPRFFSRYINLHKYFTNTVEDSQDNLREIFNSTRRELPAKSLTDTKAEYELKMIVNYLQSSLNSHPRVFQPSDLF